MGDLIEINFDQTNPRTELFETTDNAVVIPFPKLEDNEVLVENWRQRRAGQTLASRMIKRWC